MSKAKTLITRRGQQGGRLAPDSLEGGLRARARPGRANRMPRRTRRAQWTNRMSTAAPNAAQGAVPMKTIAAFGLSCRRSPDAPTVGAPQDLLTARARTTGLRRAAAALDPADLHIAKETARLGREVVHRQRRTRKTRETRLLGRPPDPNRRSRAPRACGRSRRRRSRRKTNASQTATVRTTSAALGSRTRRSPSRASSLRPRYNAAKPQTRRAGCRRPRPIAG